MKNLINLLSLWSSVADNEYLKASQMHSYFSRVKSSRQKDHKIEDYDNEDVEAFKEE